MDRAEYTKPDFPADAFAGTAVYYARYRVPYSEVLTNDLLKRTGNSGDGTLLDLACGPGRIAIPLASSFREVWAIDREPEMIEVAEQEAKRQGTANIRWLIGKAENLAAEANSFQLITIGDAFHRLDQELVASQALEWLSPGCCLAIMGCYNLMRGLEPWQRIVVDTVAKWVGQDAVTNGGAPKPEPGSGSLEGRLLDAGFSDARSFTFVQQQTWTFESIVGHLYSTSRCSRKVLGDVIVDFEADLKQSLIGYEASGVYVENMRCGYTLAEKPHKSSRGGRYD